MITPTRFLRLVVDPVRLAVLGAAAAGPVDPAALAGEIGAHERRVRKELGSLVEAGLLTDTWVLDREALRAVARALPQDEPIDPDLLEGPWTEDEALVLSRFFSGGRLVEIPSQHAKRRVVLERLAVEFEPGLRYTEREVNAILQVFHPDYAALRRYLVDDGLLTRADGSYWRSGGRVDA
ncbi:MAG: DUF2087 domain-containing protein [Acidimicrobiia bacterium]|nr:DUF2087 domain-containing protein [Acidimicrobiia bacterium]